MPGETAVCAGTIRPHAGRQRQFAPRPWIIARAHLHSV